MQLLHVTPEDLRELRDAGYPVLSGGTLSPARIGEGRVSVTSSGALLLEHRRGRRTLRHATGAPLKRPLEREVCGVKVIAAHPADFDGACAVVTRLRGVTHLDALNEVSPVLAVGFAASAAYVQVRDGTWVSLQSLERQAQRQAADAKAAEDREYAERMARFERGEVQYVGPRGTAAAAESTAEPAPARDPESQRLLDTMITMFGDLPR